MTDLLVVVLPLVIFIRLQGPNSKLSKRQIVIVNILFAAGFFATIAGAIRTYVTWRMTSADDFNITYWFWLTWLSSMIEIYVGIIAASVPATKPFMARYVPALLGASRSTDNPSRGSRTDRYALPGANRSRTKNGYVRDDSYDLPFYESASTVSKAVPMTYNSRKTDPLPMPNRLEEGFEFEFGKCACSCQCHATTQRPTRPPGVKLY